MKYYDGPKTKKLISQADISNYDTAKDTFEEHCLKSPDELKRITFLIAHCLIHKNRIDTNSEDKLIIEPILSAVSTLTKLSDTRTKLTCKKMMDSIIQNPTFKNKNIYLALQHEDIIKKFGEKPSWAAFLYIMSSIPIMEANIGPFYTLELKFSMEKCVTFYISDHFRLFFKQNNGWTNLIVFIEHIEKSKKTYNTDLHNINKLITISVTLTILCCVIIKLK